MLGSVIIKEDFANLKFGESSKIKAKLNLLLVDDPEKLSIQYP